MGTGIGGIATVIAVHGTCTVQGTHIAQGSSPISESTTVGIFQPDQAGAVVGDRAVTGCKLGARLGQRLFVGRRPGRCRHKGFDCLLYQSRGLRRFWGRLPETRRVWPCR